MAIDQRASVQPLVGVNALAASVRAALQLQEIVKVPEIFRASMQPAFELQGVIRAAFELQGVIRAAFELQELTKVPEILSAGIRPMQENVQKFRLAMSVPTIPSEISLHADFVRTTQTIEALLHSNNYWKPAAKALVSPKTEHQTADEHEKARPRIGFLDWDGKPK